MSFLPSKRVISTCLSLLTTIATARSISSAVGAFFTPIEPLVSTLISYPICAAAFSNASAAK